MSKPILCVDFDGVLHAYTSGWKGVDVIPDGPVPGAVEFLANAVECFRVVVYSSRSKDAKGIDAMRAQLSWWLIDGLYPKGKEVFDAIEFAHEKPAAFLTLDDRAVCFTGVFPQVDDLLAFKPWNKQ